MCQWHFPLSCWHLKDLLQALLSGLRLRRLSSASAVQAAHSPLWHPSQSQCGTTVGFLRVRHAAGAYVFYHTWARNTDGYDGPGVWHQRRNRQGDHLHPAGSGHTRTSEAQGAGHHHLAAGPHYLPEHLHHLYLHLDVSLLSLCAAFQMTLPPTGLWMPLTHKAIPQKPCAMDTLGLQRSSNIQDKVDMIRKWVSWRCVPPPVTGMS